jgi:anaerobic ribonucleoside-triphosphate reductase activating protein
MPLKPHRLLITTCYVPETHDADGGAERSIADVAAAAFDPAGEPRDGFTVLGGEPFFQPVALAALLRAFKARGAHTVVYSGYTLETLHRRPEPEVSEALRLVDLLIDGPFIAALAEGAGEWRGSRNQRVLALVGARTVTPQDEFRRQ